MKELRERLSAKLKELRQILEKAKAEKRALTADEETQYAALKTEADSIKSQIATEERSAELQAETDANEAQLQAIAPATQAGQRSEAQDTEARGRVEVLTPKYERGDALGSIVTARFRFGTDRDAAVKWAERQYGSGSQQVRALQQSVFTSGGATIGGNFVATELIEFLRASAQVRKAGARELPLVNGSATIPKVTGGATAYWGANEGDNITPSEETTGDVQLTEKKLTCLVPVSNDLLKNSTLAVDRLIRDDITRAAANAEDIAFLKGDGTKGSPRGIYYWVGATGRGNSAGTSLANSRTDIATSLNRLGNANAPMVKRAWFMHSRSAELRRLAAGRRERQLRVSVAAESERRRPRWCARLPGQQHLDRARWRHRLGDLLRGNDGVLHRRQRRWRSSSSPTRRTPTRRARCARASRATSPSSA
jgi:HK97 family phage major capsid protein